MKLMVVFGVGFAALCVACSQQPAWYSQFDAIQQRQAMEAPQQRDSAAAQSYRFKAKMICNNNGYPDNHPQFAECHQAMYTDLIQQDMKAIINRPSSTILVLP